MGNWISRNRKARGEVEEPELCESDRQELVRLRVDPRVRPHRGARRSRDGPGPPGRHPDRVAVAGAGPAVGTRADGTGRVDLHAAIDSEGRRTETLSDIYASYGDWDSVREQAVRIAGRTGPVPARLDGEVAAALRGAESDPANLTDAQALALMTSDGPELAPLVSLADVVRRDVVGDEVSCVVNRNINFTNVCYTGCRFCAFAQRRTDA